MELWQEIFLKALKLNLFDGIKSYDDLKELFDNVCYRALEAIKRAIEDDSIEDEECFMKIENIVCVLEELGSSGGNRHDFG